MLSIFQLYASIASGISVLINAFLLVLSANKSIDAMQELRYFLSNVSVAAIVFSVCNFLIQPQMVFPFES
ncbi:unnamed protein product, partial [Mesorhabditis belari]|uniref:Uncharacterized protein n=1 Tax=Mesorhabditis belari TaxID=2138241 RepID=A0AAF3EBW7_9BILA